MVVPLPGAHQAGGAAGAGAGCQAAYRRRNQSTVRLTAARCGVRSNGPKAARSFDASDEGPFELVQGLVQLS
jgi:hypothetical protein